VHARALGIRCPLFAPSDALGPFVTVIVSGVDISVQTSVRASLAIVWREFNQPSSILQWDATPDWVTSWCANEVRVGGRLEQLIEPRSDGSPLHFRATYVTVEPMRSLTWQTDQGQTVRVEFADDDRGNVTLHQTFSADPAESVDEQREEWQRVLDGFARHVACVIA
jgi:uncharacterized protein YndB with AHSA1/START domain